jgi:hypothetical protein
MTFAYLAVRNLAESAQGQGAKAAA